MRLLRAVFFFPLLDHPSITPDVQVPSTAHEHSVCICIQYQIKWHGVGGACWAPGESGDSGGGRHDTAYLHLVTTVVVFLCLQESVPLPPPSRPERLSGNIDRRHHVALPGSNYIYGGTRYN